MRALIWDTETTDLIKNTVLPLEHQPHIIEFFGQIVTREGEVLREFETFIDPGMKIGPVTTKITGITQQDLIGAPSFNQVEGEIRSLFADADAMVAHNLSYDYQMLTFELQRTGTLGLMKWPLTRICTVQETEWIKGFRLNLTSLHEHLFGVPFSGAHRAREDVQALTRCFVELCKRGDL